ncbi:MAG TPA: ECF-type sigma factor [Planctomycetota bacterium]|nr:ECF-type sigma factor [Planctomycetota bacterium]
MRDPRGSRRDGEDVLFARVYDELKRLARQQMAGERAEHSVQATALVSEVWLRLRTQLGDVDDNPGGFYAAAAESMRRILIDRARSRGCQKRGGNLQRLSLDLVVAAESADLEQVLAIDAAIARLAVASPRSAELVRLRFFAGLSEAAAASALGISERTARRDWIFARAWLFEALNG